MDIQFLPPTSNMCERIFSKAGCASTDRKCGIQPPTIEQKIFLHANTKTQSYGSLEVIRAVVSCTER